MSEATRPCWPPGRNVGDGGASCPPSPGPASAQRPLCEWPRKWACQVRGLAPQHPPNGRGNGAGEGRAEGWPQVLTRSGGKQAATWPGSHSEAQVEPPGDRLLGLIRSGPVRSPQAPPPCSSRPARPLQPLPQPSLAQLLGLSLVFPSGSCTGPCSREACAGRVSSAEESPGHLGSTPSLVPVPQGGFCPCLASGSLILSRSVDRALPLCTVLLISVCTGGPRSRRMTADMNSGGSGFARRAGSPGRPTKRGFGFRLGLDRLVGVQILAPLPH